MLLTWGHLFVLALATATVTVTLSRAKVFQPLRLWLQDAWPWAGRLIACTYCTSHWVAMPLTIALLWPVAPAQVLPAVLQWLAVVAMAAPAIALVMLAHKAVPPANGG